METIGIYLGEPVAPELMKKLWSSTEALVQFIRPAKPNSRGSTGVYFYVGYWKKSSSVIYRTAAFRTAAGTWWARYNQSLWDLLGNLAAKHFPDIYCNLMRVMLWYRFACWAVAGINWNHPVTKHKDKDDAKPGICCVLIFGDFFSGELCFPDDAVIIKTRHGSLVMFYSYLYEHIVGKFLGIRNSIVLFTPQDVIDYTYQDVLD